MYLVVKKNRLKIQLVNLGNKSTSIKTWEKIILACSNTNLKQKTILALWFVMNFNKICTGNNARSG